MGEVFEYRSSRRAPGDTLARDRNELTTEQPTHPLDSPASRKVLRQLLQWFYYERDRQAANRLEMAIDHDFYDNLQWDQDDALAVSERGQAPLVYNEVAPMCDWIIGTERRNRVDWRVLPRTEDDVQGADTKTKVLKYVSDINKVVFARSRAFADAVKGGLGWVDDGVRDDPTKDIIYSGYESWRNVLHDSSALDIHNDDEHRYRFRWRWVDEDIACFMFPDRKDRIYSAVDEYSGHIDPLQDEDTWSTPYDGTNGTVGRSGTYAMPLGSGLIGEASRRRVKLIECQFRMPVATKIVTSGPMKGSYFHPSDGGLIDALNRFGGTIIDKIAMRTHVAVFTESDLLSLNPSVFRHNRFSTTPVVCYRRSRDNMPYGAIRRVRDIQKDLNKRASKALFTLNTNQIVGEEGAFEDIEDARDEAQRPDGVLLGKSGKKWEIRRDTDAATGQMQIMVMDAQSIQKSGGVTDENLGRKTNAISGAAIEARQNQGAVVTTEIFDNLRLSVQVQGEKQLSLVEQFYSEEKVIRLTGAKGALDWVKINVPEVQPDGSVRYLNDITASQADFVVTEADYAGTLRQVMFDSMNAVTSKVQDPATAMRLLTIAFEYSDLPNKDDIADALRKLTGDRDPNKPMTPEEAQQAAAQMQQQAEAAEVAKQAAMAQLAEQQGKAREINARAAKIEAEIEQIAGGAGDAGAGSPELAKLMDLQQQLKLEDAVRKVQQAAAAEIDALAEKLRKAQADQTAKIMQINREADTAPLLEQIKADAVVQAAEISKASDRAMDALMKRIDDIGANVTALVADLRKDMAREVDDAKKLATEAQSAAEGVGKKVEQVEKAAAVEPAAAPAPAAAAAPAAGSAGAGGPGGQPVVLMVQPAEPAPRSRSVKVAFRHDKDGELLGATVKREDGSTDEITIDKGKP